MSESTATMARCSANVESLTGISHRIARFASSAASEVIACHNRYGGCPAFSQSGGRDAAIDYADSVCIIRAAVNESLDQPCRNSVPEIRYSVAEISQRPTSRHRFTADPRDSTDTVCGISEFTCLHASSLDARLELPRYMGYRFLTLQWPLA